MRNDETKPLVYCTDMHGVKHACTPDQLKHRPSIYAITLRENDILVVDTTFGLTLPGGAIELGEKHLDALKREVFEETNTHVFPEIICHCDTSLWYYKDKFHHCLCLFYLCRYESGVVSDINLTADERKTNCKPFWIPIAKALDRGFALTADWRTALTKAFALRK